MAAGEICPKCGGYFPDHNPKCPILNMDFGVDQFVNEIVQSKNEDDWENFSDTGRRENNMNKKEELILWEIEGSYKAAPNMSGVRSTVGCRTFVLAKNFEKAVMVWYKSHPTGSTEAQITQIVKMSTDNIKIVIDWNDIPYEQIGGN